MRDSLVDSSRVRNHGGCLVEMSYACLHKETVWICRQASSRRRASMPGRVRVVAFSFTLDVGNAFINSHSYDVPYLQSDV